MVVFSQPLPRHRRMARNPNHGGTLVIQPLPGVGDMIWHLPYIHAIAATTPKGKVSLLTKARSRADSLLSADPSIDHILWLERNPGRHDGLLGAWRLARLLRRQGFQRVFILHSSARYAWVSWLAGIPSRIGYGHGTPKWLLTNRKRLEWEEKSHHPARKAARLLELCAISCGTEHHYVPIPEDLLGQISARYVLLPKPWIALGIGSSTLAKQWGQENFAGLGQELLARFPGSLLLFGGTNEADMGRWITNQLGEATDRIGTSVELAMDEATALLSRCILYVGNDTGFLNIAAALRIHALGLFGASPPLQHSPFIHAVLPPDGRARDFSSHSMKEISVEAVLNRSLALLEIDHSAEKRGLSTLEP